MPKLKVHLFCAKLDFQLNENQREFNVSCIGKEMICLCEGIDKTVIYDSDYVLVGADGEPVELDDNVEFRNDTVSVTNLNRQLIALHSTVGLPKTQVLAERLRDIAPHFLHLCTII